MKLYKLSVLDSLPYFRNLTRLLFAYEIELEADVLMEALKIVLGGEFYFPLTGRLTEIVEGNGKGLAIVWEKNKTGVPFVLATYEGAATVKELFGNEQPKDLLREPFEGGAAFFWRDHPLSQSNCLGIEGPLLAIQLTHFANRSGSVLGVYFQHAVGDGKSMFQFMKCWSAVTKNLKMKRIEHLSLPKPVHSRGMAEPFNHGIDLQTNACFFEEIAVQYPSWKLPSPNPYPILPILAVTPLPPSVSHVFHIPQNVLSNLKAQAMAELSLSSEKSEEKVHTLTTNDVVSAFLWREFSRARGLYDSDSLPLKLAYSFDGRSRFNPPLSEDYFGNVVFTAVAQALSGKQLIVDLSLGEVALIVRKETLRCSNPNWVKHGYALYQYIKQHQGLEVENGFDFFYGTDLLITNWITFNPFSSSNFGDGKPIFASFPYLQYIDGTAIISLSSHDNVSVFVNIHAQHFPLLQQSFANLLKK